MKYVQQKIRLSREGRRYNIKVAEKSNERLNFVKFFPPPHQDRRGNVKGEEEGNGKEVKASGGYKDT